MDEGVVCSLMHYQHFSWHEPDIVRIDNIDGRVVEREPGAGLFDL